MFALIGIFKDIESQKIIFLLFSLQCCLKTQIAVPAYTSGESDVSFHRLV